MIALPFPILDVWWTMHHNPEAQISQWGPALREAQQRSLWKTFESTPTNMPDLVHTFHVWWKTQVALTRKEQQQGPTEPWMTQSVTIDMSIDPDGHGLLEWKGSSFGTIVRLVPDESMLDAVIETWSSCQKEGTPLPIAGFGDTSPCAASDVFLRAVSALEEDCRPSHPTPSSHVAWVGQTAILVAWLTLPFIARTREDVDRFFQHATALGGMLFTSTWHDETLIESWLHQAEVWCGGGICKSPHTPKPLEADIPPFRVGHSQACWSFPTSATRLEPYSTYQLLWLGRPYECVWIPWTEILCIAHEQGWVVKQTVQGAQVMATGRAFASNSIATLEALRFTHWTRASTAPVSL